MAESVVRLTEAPIELEPLVASLAAPAHGGVVTFLGVVRDHHAGRLVTGIHYHAYAAMAEREMSVIVAEVEQHWPVRVALRHRVGAVAVGEVAVAVVVAGAHREEAFSACRRVIDEVKRRVPIWKHERYADGTTAWVDPTAGEGST